MKAEILICKNQSPKIQKQFKELNNLITSFMKKWKLKQMREAAKKLNQGAHVIPERIKGSEILELNPRAVDDKGNQIDPTKYYKRPKAVPTSNYRKLKKFFKNPEHKSKLNKRVVIQKPA